MAIMLMNTMLVEPQRKLIINPHNFIFLSHSFEWLFLFIKQRFFQVQEIQKAIPQSHQR
jgi:hypothetical protein